MTASASLYKRKTLFFVILLIVFSAFTADILDLREDLHILSAPYSSLDSSITTGITDNVDFKPAPAIHLSAIDWNSSVKISFLHLLPHGFRAPPSRS